MPCSAACASVSVTVRMRRRGSARYRANRAPSGRTAPRQHEAWLHALAQINRAARRVGVIVAAVARMIACVLAGPLPTRRSNRRSSRINLSLFGRPDLARCEMGDILQVNFRSCVRSRDLIPDASLGEGLRNPFAAIAITDDLAQP